ncbi:MAG: N-methyl-L-tryptophan oxidase [Actinomycetota bacterium]|nr:N-methyl-L-tryptophan oxidase [Actinomycetota bacterium]
MTTVAVVGLGGLGSAAAYSLARRGADVIGFEQFELGHVRGASHDHSRIIRRSYHTPHYVRLTADAYRAWRDVENHSGQQVITTTGGIDLFPRDAAIDHGTYTSSLDSERVAYEWLDGAEVRRRWPAFAGGHLVADDVMAIHSPDTGIVPPNRSTTLLQQLAREHGAQLRERTPVRGIRPVGGEVDVITDEGATRVGAVVLTVDAWANRLLQPLGLQVPLAVTREQVSYFPRPDLERFGVGRFPVWIWMDDPSFYGFPVFGPVAGLKGSEDCGGPPVHPDTRSFEPDPKMEARLQAFMEGLVGPGFGAPATTTCLYTLTADRDFLLDRLPEHPQVCIALGAAHGFKFAAWFGEQLAALALGQSTGPELAPFAFSRPSLHEPIDRSAWLV